MAFAAKLCANQTGDDWRDTAKLRVAEGVLGARREKCPVRPLDSLRYSNNAMAVLLQGFINLGQKSLLMERYLRQQEYVWGVTLTFSGECTCGGRPTRMPSHHLQDKHLG